MYNINQKFRLKPIWEFLDGSHLFYIPSYQRGYRWDKKQVEDLLNDIYLFSRETPSVNPFYCLQPIVVKRKTWESHGNNHCGWEVIDGQQRLTTLLLLLIYLVQNVSDAKDYEGSLYRIFYQTRPDLDFYNIDSSQDIDSYYVANASNIIRDWFQKNKRTISNSALVDVLLKDTQKPQVKFIWYEVDDEKDNDIASIRVFNNLNKGKIRLTNSELIKALFILRAKDQNNSENLNISEIAYVWNDIECKLHNDRMWYFLSSPSETYSTRIDLIFDFLTEKKRGDDDDYSYRKFQKLFESCAHEEGCWYEAGIDSFTKAWNKTKEVFQTFSYWFEDNVLYHYIGFLIAIGVPLKDIYMECMNVDKNETTVRLKRLIKNKINPKNELIISDLDYYDKPLTKNILLLFNIESYIKHNKSYEGVYYRFPFDLYKNNSWDVEHVVSQTENPLIDHKDKIVWLSFIPKLNCSDRTKQEASELKENIQLNKKDEGNKFNDIYVKVLSEIQKETPFETDNISNLALLDAGTNRGYGNALYPTKRQEIIKKDKSGGFVPLCTKNMFLKYYSDKDDSISQWENSWTNDDAIAYLKAIEETLSWIY